MYTSFRMQNFRSFEDLELTDLARINLIAGKNNVGKTTVLQAIWLFAGYYHEAIKDMLDFRDGETPHKLDLLFHEFNMENNIILANEKRRLTLVSMSPVELSIEPGGLYFSIEDIEVNSELPTGSTVIFLKARERISTEDDEMRFNQLKVNRQTQFLVDTLRIIESRLTNIEYLPNGFYADLQGFSKLLPLSSMGDGMRQLMSLLLAITDAQGGIILIDEIENGLHYSVITDVWKLLADAARRFDVQLFATTHSGEMIQAAHEAFKDSTEYDFRYHRLDRRKTGEVTVTTYSEETMEASFELDLEVR